MRTPYVGPCRRPRGSSPGATDERPVGCLALLLDPPGDEEEGVRHVAEAVPPGHRGRELPGVDVMMELVEALLQRVGDLLLLDLVAGGDELLAELLGLFVAGPAEPVLLVAGCHQRDIGDR